MRLLHTKNLVLKEFYEDETPPYAVLSHRWIGDEEISYEEYIAGHKRDSSGYRKILRSCELARQPNLTRPLRKGIMELDWIWIDTCCIDKRSSAELSEAINSMFMWYQKAVICLAYLSDVDRESYSWVRELKDSQWFKRGWTLQELVAPSQVYFYDQHFQPIGSKRPDPETSGRSLLSVIHQITRIPKQCLTSPDAVLSSTSVAQRMSWAAGRRTTRIEDMAYCLLGIFDVNLPLLYGEGRKAFIRLQYEILNQSGDATIFAWIYDGSTANILSSSPLSIHTRAGKLPWNLGSMFATWPDDFKFSGSIQLSEASDALNRQSRLFQRIGPRSSIELTMVLPLQTLPGSVFHNAAPNSVSYRKVALLNLGCKERSTEDSSPGFYTLKDVYVLIVYDPNSDTWARIPASRLFYASERTTSALTTDISSASKVDSIVVGPPSWDLPFFGYYLLHKEFERNVRQWISDQTPVSRGIILKVEIYGEL